jgi:hypothetical protein
MAAKGPVSKNPAFRPIVKNAEAIDEQVQPSGTK